VPEIFKLPVHVANQIAAGEVVQRPASVVKELLENAVDAESKGVTLIIKESGKELISVIDDGVGIDKGQLELAFERHATSKIRSAEDLFSLSTKGFRGEALASIAAIAQVSCKSRVQGSEEAFEYTNHGGQSYAIKEVVAEVGTSISVRHLFFNIPARRNFLKSNSVELKHCIDEFQRVALIHTDIHWKMYSDDQVLFDLPPSNLLQRIGHIFGSKYPERVVPIQETTEVVTISGYVQKPQFAKKSRQEQFFFVNGRYVRHPYLHKAVVKAYEGLLNNDYQPGYFIFLKVDPSMVDVNIHPTKTEIKLVDEYEIFTLLQAAVRHSLGQFRVNASIDFDLNPDYQVDYRSEKLSSPGRMPKVQVDPSFNPFLSVDASDSLGFSQLVVETESEQTTFSEDFERGTVQFDTSQSPIQLDTKYLVIARDSKLVLIDQYRAHQRVIYEQLLAAMTVEVSNSQQWLFSEEIELNPSERNQFSQIEDQLGDLGFAMSLKDNQLTLSGGPEFLDTPNALKLFKELLNLSQDKHSLESFSTAELSARILSRNMAIRSGVKLTSEQMRKLLEDLNLCKERELSPDQKLIFRLIDVHEIARKF
jgi:DNA mismatch repair protein MutL